MEDFKILAEKLIKGTSAEIKTAKKEIKRIADENPNWCKSHKNDYFDIVDNFDQIKDAKHQAAFIDGTSVFFWHLRHENFNELKNFTLRALQSPHGNVRESIRKAADWLHILILGHRPESDEEIWQYIQYVRDLEALIEKYPADSRSKYIDKMPPSINKTVQMVWARIASYPAYYNASDRIAPDWIRRKREQIGKSMKHLIIKCNDDVSADLMINDIRRIIFFEDNQNDLSKLIAMINADKENLQEVIAACNEAWNYFPHDGLGGKCPAEMARDFASNHPEFINLEAPIWREMNDVPNISLNWENGTLAMKSGNNFFVDKSSIGADAGEKDEMLRFYFVFTPLYDMEFSKGMAAHFEMAINSAADQYDFEVEAVNVKKNYATVAILIPSDIAPAKFGNKIIRFIGKGKDRILKPDYLVNNTTEPTSAEIEKYLDYLDANNIE